YHLKGSPVNPDRIYASQSTGWFGQKIQRSDDGGKTWQIKTEGLPQENAYAVVLREGMSADRLEPAGVYFGTTGGALFASRDEGETWRVLANFLPPVLSVSCA
ncbi:MAG: hypothetical protein K6T17_08625, partial [Fimbriimonadales bacterium]|nr:hypothetical protein [Fimbriimonadales bacterium]